MKLKNLHVSDYKNLKDLSMDLSSDSFVEILVGKNGSGKSNILEAILKIFLHMGDSKISPVDFNYEICYEIGRDIVNIKYNKGRIYSKVNSNRIKRENIPSVKIILYYSGHNKNIGELYKISRDNYLRKLARSKEYFSHDVVFINKDFSGIIFLVLAVKNYGEAREFIFDRLKIVSSEASFSIIIGQPRRFIKKPGKTEDPNGDLFWQSYGKLREFLLRLMSASEQNSDLNRGYNKSLNAYFLDIKVENFQREFIDDPNEELFDNFEMLSVLGALLDIRMRVGTPEGYTFPISELSDGQFQMMYVYAISQIFGNRNCLAIMDEPDSFMHPSWQFDFFNQIAAIHKFFQGNINVLLTSHSAATISSYDNGDVGVLELEDTDVKFNFKSKKEVIRMLSNNSILYSEMKRSYKLIMW